MELLIILFTLLLGGCTAPNESTSVSASYKAEETVTFTLPAWPPDENFPLDDYAELKYPSLSHWEIKITQAIQSDEFENIGEETSNDKFSIQPTESSFSLTIPKNQLTVITARPVTKNSSGEQTLFFYPAGTVYPNLTIWDGKNYSNTLTWEDGFTAKVIDLIYAAAENSGYSKKSITDFVSHFNWKKFSDNIHSKEEKALNQMIVDEKSEDENPEKTTPFYNPWQIDLQAMIPKLLSKNFTATAMNPKKIITCKIGDIVFTQKQSEKKYYPLSPYIPENEFIMQAQMISVSKTDINHFLYKDDYLLLINAANEKKVLTEVIFIPKMIVEEYHRD